MVLRPFVYVLLGHVMAHEIAHILQGVARHSERGIMKERWESSDYKQMLKGSLRFTEHDAILIKLGLEVMAAQSDRRR